MKAVLLAVVASIRAGFRGRVALQLEVLALRHQLAVYHRRYPRTRTQLADRLLWTWLSKRWAGWRNVHVKDLVAVDFFVVPTVTFKVLFVFLVLAHARRRVVHVNVTEHPTAQWTAQQISEAFPWEAAPRYLVRDRDSVYGRSLQDRIESLGIEEVLTAPRSPWQNPFAERVIGSIRRECLEHVIVLNERHLRRLLADYFEHYHHWRCHRSLEMDCPSPRPVQGKDAPEPRAIELPGNGRVVAMPQVGGLHHRYFRHAA